MGPYCLNLQNRSSDFYLMQADPVRKRMIVCHAPEEALGPMTSVIMTRLGYEMVRPDAFAKRRSRDASLRADMLLVDERRFEEVAGYESDCAERPIPIVLLTGKRGVNDADSRIVGAVKRPAGLHDLYVMVQQLFEDTPRSTPRIATQFRVRCEDRDRNWDGRVVSLSENGCLIRSPEVVSLGRQIHIEFTLPETGSLRLEAEAAYQLLPDTGFVFNAIAPVHRQSLERFVHQTILAA